MKIVNKILVMFLVLSLMISTNVLAFSDTSGTNYEEEADFLSALGILNGVSSDTFDGEKTLTRAELSASVIRMLGYDEETLETPEKPVFIDVPLDHWAIKPVYKAYTLGIMTGKGDGSFDPDENVLYNEAVKVMVSALGYDEVALAKGGYPAGYNNVAASENVINGVKASSDGTITRGNLAKLIYNTLNAYCLTVSGYENGDAISTRDKTLLEEKLKVYFYEGMITAAGDISLTDPDNPCAEGRFIADGESFFIGETTPEKYIGKNVGIYYKKENKENTKTAIYIAGGKSYSEEVTVEADLITSDTTLSRLVYKKTKDSNTKVNLNISDNAVFVYNNRLLTIKKAEDLQIKNGEVRLIDNNKDKKYDVVFINEYETYAVETASATTMSVNTKFQKGTLDFDSDNNDISVKYYIDGEETDFSSMTSGSVLSVLKSKNIEGTVIYRVYISTDTIDGEAAEIKNKNDTYEIILSEEESYELSNDYIDRLNDGNSDTKAIEAGKKYTFYLDKFGKIVYVKDSDSVKNYGYLLYAKVFSADMDDNARFRIFTIDGEFKDFGSKDKIKFNGVSKTGDEVVSALKKKNGDTDDQLIVYKVNSADEITEIMTAADKTGDDTYVGGDDEFTLNLEQSGGLRFYKQLAENKPYMFKNSESVQFMVPADRSREKDYKIVTKLSSTDMSMPGALKIYDVKKGGKIGAVVSGTASTGKWSEPAIVDYFTQAVDENGDNCNKLYFVNGTSVTYNADDISYDLLKSDSKGSLNWSSRVDYSSVKISDLEKGDVIKYKLSDSGMLSNVAVLVRVSDIGNNRVDGDHIAESGNIIGDVITVAADSNTAVVNYVDRDGVERMQTLFIGGSGYRYSSIDKDVYAASKTEVQVGDKVLINSFWWSTKLTYIIR